MLLNYQWNRFDFGLPAVNTVGSIIATHCTILRASESDLHFLELDNQTVELIHMVRFIVINHWACTLHRDVSNPVFTKVVQLALWSLRIWICFCRIIALVWSPHLARPPDRLRVWTNRMNFVINNGPGILLSHTLKSPDLHFWPTLPLDNKSHFRH